MAESVSNRSSYFPAIEKKYGKPVKFYLQALGELGDAKYAEQISLLRDQFGFSQTHANALVMYARGSTSSKRVESPESYFASLGGEREETARAVFKAILTKYPDLDLVIAWNQPMLRQGKDYIFGLMAAKNHLLIAPWGGISETIMGRLKGLKVNKKTVQVPVDWKIDAPLLRLMVKERLDQLR